MRTAAIVQTRMGSMRLPGKVMMELAGRPVLWHVLSRCGATAGVDVVCCATTDQPGDDPVAEEALSCGAEVYRGSETDVLDRYLQAARQVEADVVLRVTCDCPLIDPEVNAQVIALRAEREVDFASNNTPPGWPHGLDCEAFTRGALELAAGEATTPVERGEFVTPWLRDNPNISKANLAGPGGALAELRWALDYPEDIAFFRALAQHLPRPPALAGWRQVAAVLEAHPEINEINRDRRLAERSRGTVAAAAGSA